MKKPRPPARTAETRQRTEIIPSFDEAIARCANIAAVAILLQGHEIGNHQTVLGEDAVAASGRLLGQEAEKLHDAIQRLKTALASRLANNSK